MALTKQLQAGQVTVAPQAALSLEVTTAGPYERPATVEASDASAPKRVTLKVFTASLDFVYEGKTLWHMGEYIHSGYQLRVPPGQTPDQYVAERQKPNYSWLEHIGLPKVLSATAIRPGEDPARESDVTSSGIVNRQR